MAQAVIRQLLSPEFGFRLQSALVGFVKGKVALWQVLLLVCFNFTYTVLPTFAHLSQVKYDIN